MNIELFMNICQIHMNIYTVNYLHKTWIKSIKYAVNSKKWN